MDAPSLTVTGASLVWTGSRTLEGSVVECSGGRVTALEPTDHPRIETLDAAGCIIVPGLVNAHHHLLQTAFRTIPGSRQVPMSNWLRVMNDAYGEVGVDPCLAEQAAGVGFAEALLFGVTTVVDHHLTWPPGVDAVEIAAGTARAAATLGGRLVFVRGTAGDQGSGAAKSVVRMAGELDLSLGGGMLQLAVGPAGVHSDDESTFRALGEVAADLGLRRRTQANEQVDVERAAERYGRRPIELLDRWDWLAPDVTLAHLCEIDEGERSLLAERGVTATHAPGCDIPMGWGVAEVGALLDAGVRVGLGTSGGASNDAGHLLADARLAMQVSGLTDRPITAGEALAMATTGSAAGLGRPELGNLELDGAADLVCYDVTGPPDAGVADPLAGLLWANPGRRPRHVVVGGRIVVQDYELLTADAAGRAAHLRETLRSRRR